MSLTDGNLTDGEKAEPLWWCNHHKQSVKYLVVRIQQLLKSDEEVRESIASMLNATLPDFAESVGVDLDEVRIP